MTDRWDQDHIPTERIPVVPPVELTREMPPVPPSPVPRLQRRPPYGAIVRRLVTRFPSVVGLLLVAAWWSGILASGERPTLSDFTIPPVEALLLWAGLFTLVATGADVAGWWLVPGRRRLPSRLLAHWLALAVVVLRPIHFRGRDIEAIADTAGWLLGAYLLGLAATVAVERWLPHDRPPTKGAADLASVLLGVTAGMLAALPFTGLDFLLTRWSRPAYDRVLGWIDPGLGDGGEGTGLALVGLVVACAVLVFVRRWRGLGRRLSYVPALVVALLLVALVLWYPLATWTGTMFGIPVWFTLVAARERIQAPR